MEPLAVVVEVVEHGQAVLVPFAVVGLGTAGTSSVGPLVGGGGTAGRPPDGRVPAVVHVTAGPEVLLVLTTYQICELPLLGRGIEGDGVHPDAAAEGGPLSVGEATASAPPAQKVVTALE